MNDNDRILTARDLLVAFLELRQMTPDLGEWTEHRLPCNPPRLYRFRRLAALFRAFGVPPQPSSFIKGEFIDSSSPRYAGLFDRMVMDLPPSMRSRAERVHLGSCFESLFAYRERVEYVLSYPTGVLAADGLFYYAHIKTCELDKVLRANLGIIDDILTAFISPESKAFTLDQLIRKYGYPTVNLQMIDAEWA